MDENNTGEVQVEAIPPKKIKCFISGKLRKNTDEEKVRQDFARTLVEIYGYNINDMDAEFKIKMGRERKKADIVIFKENSEHIQENIIIIAEAKREDVKPSDKKEGVDQLKSYCSACIKCEYGIWIGNEKIVYNIDENKDFVTLPDIPHFGELSFPIPDREYLKPAINLRPTFKRIHNYIYGNEGLHKDSAFEELQKLIFCKVYDEQYSPTLKFYILPDESDDKFKKRIDDLFNHVKQRYSFIFKEYEEINLSLRVIKYIVSELYNFNLIGTNIDIKGEAYEEIVGSNLRGDSGEYFTPRNVTAMVVEMMMNLFPEDKIISPGGLKILDPALGTGGFLITIIHSIKRIILEKGFDNVQVRDMLKEISSNNLYGIDHNSFLVKVSQMNMVMHGDGSSNVIQANSLDLPENWEIDSPQKYAFGIFDWVITNPPFGANIKIDDPDILAQYDLTTLGTKNPRNSLPPEHLFVERCLDFLKPGGYLSIVLPDSILSNPGLKWLREYILQETYIIASVDLPMETFKGGDTGTQTSVLILKKKNDIEKKANIDYDIFMALPKKVGHDQRAKPIYKQTLDGQNILDENGMPIVDDSLPLVSEAFKNWVKNQDGFKCF